MSLNMKNRADNLNYKNKESIRDFWDSRAGLGLWAGTNDIVAKEIEMAALEKYIFDGMKILEAGCGNGVSAIHIGKKFRVDITGSDFSAEMVVAAKDLLKNQQLVGKVSFRQLDILSLGDAEDIYDLIFTERVLINLTSWEMQKKAILNIFKMLKPNGIFLMLENSAEGLSQMNILRGKIGLPAVVAPWHNRYLIDAEIRDIQEPGIVLEKIDYYSSTYYFLSRIANAHLAQKGGVEPDYNSSLNRLALQLPSIGEFGQGRIWVWKKAA